MQPAVRTARNARFLRVVLVAFAATAAACSLLTEFNGLAGGPDAATPPDSVQSAPDAWPLGDASVTDSGPGSGPSDAASADADADAGPTFSCRTLTPQPTFCEDFDTRPVGVGWMNPQGDTDNEFYLGTAQFVSPPNALVVALAPSDGSKTIAREESLTATKVHFELDVRIAGSLDNTFAPLDFQINDPGGDAAAAVNFFLVLQGHTLTLWEMTGADFLQRATTSYPLLDTWYHVVLDLALDLRHVVLKVDGTTVLDTATSSAVRPGIVSYDIGNFRLLAGPYQPMTVTLDDFVVDLK
jgi:hypothetical protein